MMMVIDSWYFEDILFRVLEKHAEFDFSVLHNRNLDPGQYHGFRQLRSSHCKQ